MTVRFVQMITETNLLLSNAERYRYTIRMESISSQNKYLFSNQTVGYLHVLEIMQMTLVKTNNACVKIYMLIYSLDAHMSESY